METIEQKEVRGISIKQLVYYSIVVISFIVGLVIRDMKRENEIETMRINIQTIEIKSQAQDKEREALKTMDQTHDVRLNSQENRITKVETILQYKK